MVKLGKVQVWTTEVLIPRVSRGGSAQRPATLPVVASLLPPLAVWVVCFVFLIEDS